MVHLLFVRSAWESYVPCNISTGPWVTAFRRSSGRLPNVGFPTVVQSWMWHIEMCLEKKLNTSRAVRKSIWWEFWFNYPSQVCASQLRWWSKRLGPWNALGQLWNEASQSFQGVPALHCYGGSTFCRLVQCFIVVVTVSNSIQSMQHSAPGLAAWSFATALVPDLCNCVANGLGNLWKKKDPSFRVQVGQPCRNRRMVYIFCRIYFGLRASQVNRLERRSASDAALCWTFVFRVGGDGQQTISSGWEKKSSKRLVAALGKQHWTTQSNSRWWLGSQMARCQKDWNYQLTILEVECRPDPGNLQDLGTPSKEAQDGSCGLGETWGRFGFALVATAKGNCKNFENLMEEVYVLFINWPTHW